jgi:hypothetical protein
VRWIKHSTVAHSDAKIKRLIMDHGMAAYGLYWYCLELIGKDVCDSKLTFELEDDSELLAHATGMTREHVESAMRCMVDLGLFENIEGKIACISMLNWIDQSMFKAGGPRERFQQTKYFLIYQHNWATSDTAGTCTVHVPYKDGTCITGQDRTEQINHMSPSDDGNAPKKAKNIPYEKIRGLWNEICVPAGLSECKVLNAARKGNIRQRHTGPIIKQSLEEWREYFEAITKSDFLMGRVDGQRWRCDFDFAVSDRGMTRTLEGKYHG